MTRNVHEGCHDAATEPENVRNEARTAPEAGLLMGAFASSALYTLLLTTRQGRTWYRDHNWFVVWLGVQLTLAWLSLFDRDASAKANKFFTAAGLPLMARGLFILSEGRDEVMKRSAE